MTVMGRSWSDFDGILPRNVLQGDFDVSNESKVYFSTILGSCVAVCLHDPVNRVGGMNHILLPGLEGAGGGHSRYGVHLMELLINGVLRVGGKKSELVAKVFGAGQVASHNSDVGKKNAAFVKSFLSAEGILCVSESLGGSKARKVQFVPSSGLARQLFIDPPKDLQDREEPKRAALEPTSNITLF